MTARSGLFVAPVSGVGTAPIDGRLALAAIIGAQGQCLAGGAITTSGSSMAVAVGQSVWSIVDPTNSAAVFVSPTDTAAVTPAVGPSSGSRIDTIYAIQHDPENGGSDARASIGLAAGVASGSPSAPSPPSGGLAIATVLVPTGASNSSACTVTLLAAATHTVGLNLFAGSESALRQNPGDFVNQRGYVGSGEFRWNGTTWQKWTTPWSNYTPAFSGVNLGTGGTANLLWRWENGLARLKGDILQGSSSSITNQVFMSLPVNSSENYRAIGPLTVVEPGTGYTYPGFVQTGAPATNVAQLYCYLANDTFLKTTTIAPNQPIAAAQSTVWHIDLVFESSDNPLGTS